MIPISVSAIVTAVFAPFSAPSLTIFQTVVSAADCHRQQDQREPDVMEHALRCSSESFRSQPICYCIVDLSFNRLTR